MILLRQNVQARRRFIVRYVLKRQRKKKGYTPADMARKLKISTSYYYKIEAGSRNPTLELSNKIRDILEVSIDELFVNFSWKIK